MSTPRNDLQSEHTKSQAQFAYFLLGLAASAIAYAIHETQGWSLKEAPWPIGVAVGLWALSFGLGCFGVKARQQATITNIAFLDSTQGLNAAQVAQHMPEVHETARKDVNRPVCFFDWQLWMLFAGALFYIDGHLMQMAATPPKAVVTTPKATTTPAPRSSAPHP